MPLRLSLSTTLAACLMLAATGPIGCGRAKKSNTAAVSKLSGTVRDGDGKLVAGAKIKNLSGTIAATTDSSGRYQLDVVASALGGQALQVTAANYAPTSRLVSPAASTQDFVLRAYDSVTPVTLPTGTEAPVTATAARGDGKVALTIPANSMVRADGTVASGEAKVRLTYWNPATDMDSAPATMVARFIGDGNGPYNLGMQSFGMVDVQITQGDEQLQVAKGAKLGLDHALPGPFRRAMAQKPNDMGGPFLFYYDPNISMWSVDGELAYDDAQGTLKAQLPHLTVWNFDNFQGWTPPSDCTTSQVASSNPPPQCAKPNGATNGGCITGRALDAAGNPAAGTQVRLWTFDFEGINSVNLTTDSSGIYCYELGIRTCVPWWEETRCNYKDNQIAYLVSGKDSPNNSSMANPMPDHCSAGGGGDGSLGWVSSCKLINDPSNPDSHITDNPLFGLATADIFLGTTCGAGSCTKVPDVTLTPNGPKTVGTGVTGGTKCSATLNLGVACTEATAACCVAGTSCINGTCCDKARAQDEACAGAPGCCVSGTMCLNGFCCSKALTEGDSCVNATKCCSAPTTCYAKTPFGAQPTQTCCSKRLPKGSQCGVNGSAPAGCCDDGFICSDHVCVPDRD